MPSIEALWSPSGKQFIFLDLNVTVGFSNGLTLYLC